MKSFCIVTHLANAYANLSHDGTTVSHSSIFIILYSWSMRIMRFRFRSVILESSSVVRIHDWTWSNSKLSFLHSIPSFSCSVPSFFSRDEKGWFQWTGMIWWWGVFAMTAWHQWMHLTQVFLSTLPSFSPSISSNLCKQQRFEELQDPSCKCSTNCTSNHEILM